MLEAVVGLVARGIRRHYQVSFQALLGLFSGIIRSLFRRLM